MASLSYEQVYSRFFTKITAYDFLEISHEHLDAFLCNWIHSAGAKPYVRRLFTTYRLDDENHEIAFEMNYSTNEDSDTEFILEILSTGMVIEWLEPKIMNISNLAQLFGSKEEKFYSQSQQLTAMNELKTSLQKKQRRMIADRGYIWNSYLDGE
jgi:hypothetical protein